jgi:CheY-like chemotaxis protein
MSEKPTRILIVDDTPQNITLLDAVLTPRGYSVDTASSGADALSRVAAEPPDLILRDVSLVFSPADLIYMLVCGSRRCRLIVLMSPWG